MLRFTADVAFPAGAGRIPSTVQEDSTVAARGGRLRVLTRARAGALLAMATAGLSGYALTGAASTRPVPIRHIVVLYLENHSFDNLLGYWCNRHPARCPDGGMPSSVRLSRGGVVIPGIMPDLVPKVSHSVASERKAIDAGRMDGWGQVKGCTVTTGYACIGGYTPTQVPNLATLARRFAISDRTFSMAA